MERKEQQFYLDEYHFDLSKPLDDSYRLLGVLGAGGNSVVLHIQNKRTNHDLALKLIKNYDEIYLYVEKNIAPQSDFFIRCYGIFICDKLPENWILAIKETEKTKKETYSERPIHYGLFYEHIKGKTLHEWLHTDVNHIHKKDLHENLKGILFEILYGLINARTKFGFCHMDMKYHLGNIMVIPTDNTRKYEVSDKQFIIDSPFTVKFIDYDLSELANSHEYLMVFEKKFIEDMIGLLDRLDDMNFFYYLHTSNPNYDSDSDSDQEDFDEADQFYHTAKKNVENKNYTNILWDNIFEVFRISDSAEESTTKKHKRSNLNCHICGNASTRALKDRPSLTFCDNNDCVLKLGDLILMMK